MYVVYLSILWETDSRQAFKVSGEMLGGPFHLRFNGATVALCCFTVLLWKMYRQSLLGAV